MDDVTTSAWIRRSGQKMKFHVVQLAVVCLCVCFQFGGGQLTFLGKQCGQIKCSLSQYCNSFTNSCSSCADICDQRIHNFDEHKCEKECQAYLHDIRYARLGSLAGDPGSEDLRAIVNNLQVKVTVLLTLVCILIISLILVLCFKIWKWKSNNNVTLKTLHTKIFHKKSDNNGTAKGIDMNAQVSAKPDLRLEIPSPATQSEHSPVTATTAISRIPAEDSIDYAYDNPAMSNTSNQSRMGHVTT